MKRAALARDPSPSRRGRRCGGGIGSGGIGRVVLVGLFALLLAGPVGEAMGPDTAAVPLPGPAGGALGRDTAPVLGSGVPEGAWGRDPAAATAAPAAGVPLLLVPGWFDTERDLAALRIRFVAAGWASEHVGALTFEDPTGSNRAHALQIDSAVSRLVERSSVEAVDIVAHSMGGLATRWYLKSHPDAPVRKVVFLASPHRGTLSAHFAWGEGRDDMLPGSAFLDTLNAGRPLPEGIEAITVRTLLDTHVIPPESATLPGVPDHLICCPTHDGLLRDLEAFRIVHDFLEAPPGVTPEPPR